MPAQVYPFGRVCLSVMLLAGSGSLVAQTSAPTKPASHSGITNSLAQTNLIPRFTWSPPQGFLFVEGNCGSDDQTLGWMAPVSPPTPREAKLIMFSNGQAWPERFQEASKHFIARWVELKGREVIVVPGDYGRLKDDAVVVRVPTATPFAVATMEEAMFLQGYAGGFMDFVNLRQSSEAPVDGARGQGWRAGWKEASNSGVRWQSAP